MSTDVQLMITCLIDTLYPEVGEAVVRILQRAGMQVYFPPDQTCCGQPAFNAGLRAQARQMAEHTLQVFSETSGPIVIPSGSCAAMIRHGYLELFAGDPTWLPRAQAIAKRTYEFSQFLVDIVGMTDFGVRYPGKITYHASCHLLRELGVDAPPRALIAHLQDADIIEMAGADECCGFGGVFSVEHPDISAAMLERKIANLESTGADMVVSCDAGCITHINGGLHRQGKPPCAVHIAEILDRS